MNCKNCGGRLVAREWYDYPIDDRGVYYPSHNAGDVGVFCLDCGARHAVVILQDEPSQVTVALEYESDPDPVASLILVFEHGVPTFIRSDYLVGLIVIDEDRQEVGTFKSRPDDGSWWARVKELQEHDKTVGQ